MPIKLFIYEDNEHLRNSLTYLFKFNQEFEAVVIKPNPSSVLNDYEKYRPDVILMDIDMPVMTGIEAVSKLRENRHDVPVIMLTVFDDGDNIFNAICAGANGYLLKNDFEHIIPAIRDVLKGGAPLTGSVARMVLSAFANKRPSKAAKLESLTDRENQILELLVLGFSYKMIADKLDLSLDTIRTHIKKIYKKLQVNSATEAVYKAKLEGLL